MKPTIDQIRSLGDFASVFRWKVIFVSLPTVGVAALPLTDELDLRCETATIPKTTNASVEVNIRGMKVKQPGITSFDHMLTLTFVETVDNTISNFIKAWREAIYSTKEGQSANKENLEATITLLRLNSKDESIWQYTLHGCYLEDFDLGTLDGASPEVIRPSLILSYDYFTDGPL